MAGERVLGPAEEASEAWLEVSPGLLLRRLATGNFVGDINAMATLAGDAAFRVSLLSLGDLEASGEVTFTLVIEAAGLLVTPFLLILVRRDGSAQFFGWLTVSFDLDGSDGMTVGSDDSSSTGYCWLCWWPCCWSCR